MSVRTIVVAHRHHLVAEGLAGALRRFPALLPVACTSSSAGAREHGASVDAVALDAMLPGATEAADHLRRCGVRVVFVGEPAQDDLDDGVRVRLGDPISLLASALAPGAGEPIHRRTARLTRRELDVLRLTARGLSGRETARTLGISPKTVERHKTKIHGKLAVTNQTAAVSAALATGVLDGTTWS